MSRRPDPSEWLRPHPTPEDLEALAHVETSPCVTIAVETPAQAPAPEVATRRARMRALARDAARALMERGMSRPEAEQFVAPAMALAEEPFFWTPGSRGVVCYLRADGPAGFRTPWSPGDRLVVGPRPALRPLLPAVDDLGGHYALVLTRKHVRLLSCHEDGCERVALPDAPERLEDVIPPDRRKLDLHFHAGGNPQSGQDTPVYHVSEEADLEPDLRKFVHDVLEAVRRRLATDVRPIVLVAPDEILGLARNAPNRPATLVEETVHGSYDESPDDEIRALVRPIVERLHEQRIASALERVEEAVAKGRGATDVESVLRAAEEGRVELLVVAPALTVWGHVHPETFDVSVTDEPGPEDEELVERAVARTIRAKGECHLVRRDRIPGPAGIAARLRY